MTIVLYGVAVALIGLTFWRKDIFLYLITCPLSIAMGLQSFQSVRTPFSFVLGVVLIAIGIYCLYQGLKNIAEHGKV